MTPELWARLNPLFHEAVEKPPGERSAFIADVCGDDSELRRELTALIDAHEQQGLTADKIAGNIRNLAGRTQPAFSPGEIVINRFRIVRMLGNGGMGDVYEAFDLELSQAIALKSIRPEIVESTGVLSRFRKEVQFARRLNGPNVCRIHELFIIGSSAAPAGAFLTMELLDGITLSERILQTGPLPWREAQSFVNDICAGLAAIHDAGIIHRDLKSRNIMLVNRAGSVRAVVMDFGLAHEVSSSKPEEDTALTLPGAILGTPEYMAPEQFEGTEVTPATDLFALGIVLYEMLTGKSPFPSSNILGAAVLRGKRVGPVSSIQKGIPNRFDLVIGKCLEYDASRRYQSARELARALHNRTPALAELPRKVADLSRTQIAAIVIVLVALGIATTVRYRSASYHAPNQRVLDWYNAGTASIREGAYLQATGELQQAADLDKNFPLPHARLAEAWSELDFTGLAERELLMATVPEKVGRLPALDKDYIEAVRATLTHDFKGAVQEEMTILEKLPQDQKGYGYVDLGRAEEKAGDISNAIKSYETAAQLAPDNPAPFVHLGILKSELQDGAGSEAAYKTAEALYRAKGDFEGLGEVAFQRGHSANVRGDSASARDSLAKCLKIADQISSVQLRVRALTQLSNADYYSIKESAAIDEAEKARILAQEKGLEYWVTDASIREANAYLVESDLKNAEAKLQKALLQAKENQHARLEATAELTLASVRDQQGRRDDEIQLAQRALSYFKSFGMVAQEHDATLLLTYGLEGKGNYAEALQSGLTLLEISEKSNSPADTQGAHEAVGDVLLDIEQYPEALAHYEAALSVGKSMNGNIAYQSLHCASVLWRLGRYDDAETIMRAIPAEARKRGDISSGIDLTSAEMRLSQRRFLEAKEIAASALKRFANMTPGKIADLKSIETLAAAELGQFKEAQQDAQQLIVLARNEGDDNSVAHADLTQAIVYIRAHLPALAKPLAESAHQHFENKGLAESEWLSLSCLAETFEGQGDQRAASENARKALDIIHKMEQTWGSPVFKQYTSRPDIQAALRQLSK